MVRHHHHNVHRILLDAHTAAPLQLIGSRGSSVSHSGGGNFDSNMMVILAALLCALIGALVINSIIRCVIRCSQRFAIDADRVLSELAPTGLSKDALSQIPVVAYEPGLEIPVKECCPICLGEFGGGEKIRILPKCGHGFHVKCIDTWLLSHSSCPNCRLSVI